MNKDINTLKQALRGPVITADDADYDDARSVYNGMHDRRPAAILQCLDAADVMTAVAMGRDSGLDVAVRGGGHSVPGWRPHPPGRFSSADPRARSSSLKDR